MKKNILLIIGALFVSVLLAYFTQSVDATPNGADVYHLMDAGQAVFDQKVIAVNDTPAEITKLYREGKLVGIIHDSSRLENLIQQVYETEYKEEFPDSKLGLMDDIYQTKELSYNQYEDIDEKIFDYIKGEKLFAIEVNKVTFSNGAVIYVKNLDDFEKAREDFILNFIDRNTYDLLKNDQKIEGIKNYGVKNMSFSVLETLKFSRGLATREDILQSADEIKMFLSYGYNPQIEEYTVQEYDTVQGISQLHGMSSKQLALLNNSTIMKEDQILAIGTKLNITNFNSPLTVTVQQERMVAEAIYPEEPIYEEDPTLREGTRRVKVAEENGSADVVYLDTYVNGKNTDSQQVSHTVTKEPVREVVVVGTYVEPKVGSGNFRWPLNNAYVMCHYGCYYNHRGTDFGSYGNPYSTIYAIDRGVVTKKGYDAGGWGYYVVIDHNNGYTSLYAHMMTPSYTVVGQTVAKSEAIGQVGMTGYTTAPHVHLEIRYYGSIINACSVLGC